MPMPHCPSNPNSVAGISVAAISLHGPWDLRLTVGLGMKQQRVAAILDGDRVHAGDIPAKARLISCG